MSGFIKSVINKLTIYKLRRNEMESVPLREYFSKNFDINVGLYSYGCFDPWRISHHTTIGRYCSFAKSVRVLNANHPMDALSTHPYLYQPSLGVAVEDPLKYNHLVIEDDVWIGHNATITPSCATIGRGAIIGVGAVVTKSVAPYSIVTGAPARVLRMRFEPDLIASIEQTKWWELDKETLARRLRENPQVFYHPSVPTLATMIAAPPA